jgi:hypothetical protein
VGVRGLKTIVRLENKVGETEVHRRKEKGALKIGCAKKGIGVVLVPVGRNIIIMISFSMSISPLPSSLMRMATNQSCTVAYLVPYIALPYGLQ